MARLARGTLDSADSPARTNDATRATRNCLGRDLPASIPANESRSSASLWPQLFEPSPHASSLPGCRRRALRRNKAMAPHRGAMSHRIPALTGFPHPCGVRVKLAPLEPSGRNLRRLRTRGQHFCLLGPPEPEYLRARASRDR
jgi:hypothetical protein